MTPANGPKASKPLNWFPVPHAPGRDGAATRYEYTPGGRLRTQIWARSGVTNRLRYGFEEGGSAPATGDQRRIDHDGEVDLDGAAIGSNSRFEYDRLGRLTAEQQVSATSGAVLTRVEYHLNEAGQRTNEVWSAGPLANRSFLLPATALDRSHPPGISGRMARQS